MFVKQTIIDQNLWRWPLSVKLRMWLHLKWRGVRRLIIHISVPELREACVFILAIENISAWLSCDYSLIFKLGDYGAFFIIIDLIDAWFMRQFMGLSSIFDDTLLINVLIGNAWVLNLRVVINLLSHYLAYELIDVDVIRVWIIIRILYSWRCGYSRRRLSNVEPWILQHFELIL